MIDIHIRYCRKNFGNFICFKFSYERLAICAVLAHIQTIRFSLYLAFCLTGSF
uniref:Uncharacterized protein n=1 Tax=Rhizophora mucronata TaxID=61149 RepID=A0A2P2QBX8_RHIMU